MSVGALKQQLQPLLAERGLDVAVDRCAARRCGGDSSCGGRLRVREKQWKRARTIYLDHKQLGVDVPVPKQLIVERLRGAVHAVSGLASRRAGPEIKGDDQQAVLYVRRWNQATFELGPHQEIVTPPNPNRVVLRETVRDAPARRG